MTKDQFIEQIQNKILVAQSKADKINLEVARLKNILANPDPHFKSTLREKNKYQKKKTKNSSTASVPSTPVSPEETEAKKKHWMDDII